FNQPLLRRPADLAVLEETDAARMSVRRVDPIALVRDRITQVAALEAERRPPLQDRPVRFARAGSGRPVDHPTFEPIEAPDAVRRTRLVGERKAHQTVWPAERILVITNRAVHFMRAGVEVPINVAPIESRFASPLGSSRLFIRDG